MTTHQSGPRDWAPRGRARLVAFALLLSVVGACAAHRGDGDGGGADCDRACLKGQVDGYLAALLAHDPGRLKLAPDARFTEDAVPLPVGEGLWRTATAVRSFRQDYLDVRAGVAASHVVVEAQGKPVLLALRLKVERGRLREIETLTVHNAQEGMFFEADALKLASPEMAKVPSPAQRESRENLIRLAEGYPAGLKIGSFEKADTQLAADAYRFENGRRMAGPGCTFQPPSCQNMRAQRIPTLAGITYRVVAVDEELGLVLLRLDFGPGSLIPPDTRWLHAWEAFKVYGGQIHAAEAFMRGMPANTPSGW